MNSTAKTALLEDSSISFDMQIIMIVNVGTSSKTMKQNGGQLNEYMLMKLKM